MPTLRTDVPNLDEGEIPFALDSGALVTVQIHQIPDRDGHYARMAVRGRLINSDGSDALQTDAFHPEPHPVRLPETSHSVQLAALSSGATTISETIGRITAEALEQWPRYLLGLAALQHLPVRPQTTRAQGA